MKSLLSLFFMAAFCMMLGAQERGTPIFADNFDVKGTFIENWKVTGKVANDNGVVSVSNGGVISPTCPIPEEFFINVKLTLLKTETQNGPGFAGILVGDKTKFLIRPDGAAWMVYNIAGEQRARGALLKIDGFEFGKPNEITLIRLKQGDGYSYTYRVNGKEVGRAMVAKESNNTPKLWTYKEDVVYDDFQMFAVRSENSSPNVAVNSSFEYTQEGMPTFFDTDTGRSYNINSSYDEYLKTFAVDTTEKVSGKQSLKLVFNDTTLRQGVQTFDTGVVVGQPVTFSIWLKADQDNFPVEMSIWEMRTNWRKQSITISKEWKRYTFTLPTTIRPTARFGIYFSKPGTVWADDIQVEVASEPTAYKPSDLDKEKFAPKTAPAEPIKIAVPKLKTTPAMDGNIDSWISGAAKVDKFYFKVSEPQSSSVAYFGCDDSNLYVGVRAKVNDISKIKAVETPRDSFAIFGNDNIEILLDPGKSKVNYYQLVTSAANSRTDMGLGRNQKWNGNWTSAVKINEKEKSIDYEVKLPLSMLACINAAGDWGINIGRFDAGAGEASCIMPTPGTANFHAVANYPVLQLPADVTKKFAIGFSKTTITALPDGNYQFSGELENLTGEKIGGMLVTAVMRDGTKLGECPVNLKPGKNTVAMTLAKYDAKNSEITLTLQNDSGVIFAQSRFPEILEALSVCSKYNFYMNEDKADFRIQTTLADPEKLTAVVKLGNEVLKVKASRNFSVEVPITKLPDGNSELTVELQDNGKTVASVKSVLVKKPFRKGATRINNYRRCLVADGKPLLVFAPLISIWPHDKEPEKRADFLAEHGFKYAMIVISRNAVEQSLKFMKRADELGIKVIYWNHWNRKADITDEEIAADVAKLDPYSNIIGQLVIDEPELYMKSDETRDLLTRMRKFFPYVPTFMNNTVMGIPNRFADLNTDILMLDDYLTNKENRTVKGIVDQVDIMWNAGKSEHKPCHYFLVGNNMHNHYREPSAAEQYAQTYGSLAANCTGFTYFMGIPTYPAHWAAYKQLNKEILALNDVVLSEEEVAPAIVSDVRLRHITRKHDGYLYVIAVNIEEQATDTTITLPAGFKYADEADVEFEGRRIKVSGGVIKDSFQPLSRHVYKIKLK